MITGAETETGAALAVELARRGAAVAVQYDKSFVRAKELVRSIERNGGRAVAIRADLSDPSAADLLCKKAGGAFGDVDIVVASEAPPSAAREGEEDAQSIADAVRDRLLAVLSPLHAALDAMARRGSGLLVHAGSGEPAGPASEAARAAAAAAVVALGRTAGPLGLSTHTLVLGTPQETARGVAHLAEGAAGHAPAAVGSVMQR
ncbi:hypothetical protein GCM10023082_24800 [Streptomyces tremellae]|uniref:Short-chain dehydrogenase n=1 Tax=Streptomyces tremellae TaxID=1124239 RepID=A0ABP7EYX0_9ACTN